MYSQYKKYACSRLPDKNTTLTLFENYHSDLLILPNVSYYSLFDITKCLDSMHVAIFFYNQYLSSRHLLYYKTSVTSDFYVKSLVTDVCKQPLRFNKSHLPRRLLPICIVYTVEPVLKVICIKQSPVFKGHYFRYH